MVLIGLALLLVSFALARPKVQVRRTVFNRTGIDLIVGLDVSKSMLAEDAALSAEAGKIFSVANRLNRARDFALAILSELRGERIGVFLFASKGVEVVPLTRDYGFCRYILRYIHDAEITVPGSDLGEAVRTGIFLFEEEGAKAARVLVLLSDGEDTNAEPSSISEAATLAARSGIRIFTVGIGSGKSVLIPMRSEQGDSIAGYYLDEEGNHLKTRLEQDPLKAIAGLTGGRYFPAEERNASEEVMKSILQGAREVEYTKGVEPAWLACSPFLLLAGFVFFCWGTWMGR
jgi:Ca-activated chloride channel family protein